MPLKKKKYNARFPAGRIKKIMQTDEEVGKVAQAVPVIISRTLEMFVESLLTKSLHVTHSRNAKTLSPSHLKQCILAESRFDFLRDLVKNIPDVSPAEEKEASQNLSGENSPNTCRYNEVKKSKLPSQSSAASHNNNAHSSDSSSDCELSAKNKMGLPGNGRYPGLRTHDEERSAKAPPVPVVIPNPVPSHTSAPPPAHMNQVSGVGHHRLLNRPTNFYQETLRDVDEKRDSPPIYSSVIQPNPEYSGVTTAKQSTHHKKSQPLEQPKLSIDMTKGFSKNVDVVLGSTSTKPVFHIDLSAMPLTPSDSVGLPFTPTLLRQPHTPLITEANALKINPDAIYKNTLHRSESCNQYRKGPPPLQTLKRTTSTDVPMPQFKIEMNTNDGQSPRFHLDLSNYKFDSTSSPAPLTPKKRKITPNEPPALLPITPTTPTQRSPVNLSKNSTVNMQLDEDYDT